MKNIKYIALMILALALSLGFSSDSRAQGSIVVPNALTNTEGSEGGVFPLLCTFTPSTRYQQIFAAEQFNIPGQILEMRFRLDADADTDGLGQVLLADVQIDMSVTQTEPENASETFADNLGPVVETVFQGDLIINVPTCTTTPCPFVIMVPLDTPFTYNSSDGNLIVDWRMNNCIEFTGRLIDATEEPQTPTTVTERIFSGPAGGGVNSPTGTIGSNTTGGEIGLITQFVIARIAPIPTLSEWGLIAMAGVLGVIGLVALSRRKAAT